MAGVYPLYNDFDLKMRCALQVMIIGGKHVLLFHFENSKDELEGLAPKVY